jgi:hypothetical protein
MSLDDDNRAYSPSLVHTVSKAFLSEQISPMPKNSLMSLSASSNEVKSIMKHTDIRRNSGGSSHALHPHVQFAQHVSELDSRMVENHDYLASLSKLSRQPLNLNDMIEISNQNLMSTNMKMALSATAHATAKAVLMHEKAKADHITSRQLEVPQKYVPRHHQSNKQLHQLMTEEGLGPGSLTICSRPLLPVALLCHRLFPSNRNNLYIIRYADKETCVS